MLLNSPEYQGIWLKGITKFFEMQASDWKKDKRKSRLCLKPRKSGGLAEANWKKWSLHCLIIISKSIIAFIWIHVFLLLLLLWIQNHGSELLQSWYFCPDLTQLAFNHLYCGLDVFFCSELQTNCAVATNLKTQQFDLPWKKLCLLSFNFKVSSIGEFRRTLRRSKCIISFSSFRLS